ncbi:MAG: hypothetical protein IT289_07615 [Oligoflexia bacterium]|nr:hypothetical protein [Oligoflexia bacterium]
MNRFVQRIVFGLICCSFVLISPNANSMKPELNCEVMQNVVSDLVNRYASQAQLAEPKMALETRKLIETAVSQSRMLGQCHQDIKMTYLKSSLEHFATPAGVGANKSPVLELFKLLQSVGGIRFLDAQSSASSDIQGAYDCQTSTIFLNSDLPPIDLAAAFVHEVSHLYRDKLLDIEKVQSDFGLRESSDWISFLLLDETLAITQAGLFQRNLKAVEGNQYPEFGILNDRSLVSANGPLSELILHSPRMTTDQMILGQFWGCKGLESCAYANDSAVEAIRLSLYQIVYNVYFPRSAMESKVKANLAPERISDDYSSFSEFIRLGQGILKSARAMEKLKTALSAPSAVCTAFVNAYENASGTLSLYSDFEISIDAEGNWKIDKPGRDGAKPGRDGAKPGRDGAKPGRDGAKPGRDGAKPCLYLPRAI